MENIHSPTTPAHAVDSFSILCADCRHGITVEHEATTHTGSMSWSTFACPYCGKGQRHLFAVPVVRARGSKMPYPRVIATAN